MQPYRPVLARNFFGKFRCLTAVIDSATASRPKEEVTLSGMLQAVLLVFLAVLVSALWISWRRHVDSGRKGPWAPPLLGHLPVILLKGLPQTFADWGKHYGPNYEVQMDGNRWYVPVSLFDACFDIGLQGCVRHIERCPRHCHELEIHC